MKLAVEAAADADVGAHSDARRRPRVNNRYGRSKVKVKGEGDGVGAVSGVVSTPSPPSRTAAVGWRGRLSSFFAQNSTGLLPDWMYALKPFYGDQLPIGCLHPPFMSPPSLAAPLSPPTFFLCFFVTN